MAMAIVGLVLFLAGGACLWARSRTLAKAGKLRSIPPKTVGEVLAGSGGVVALQGEIVCEDPLKGELSGVSCVYYRMQVERETEEEYTQWNEQEKRNERKTRRHRETMSSNTRRCPFTLRDASGSIRVLPEGAEMEAEKVLSKFEPERAGFSLSIGGFSLNLSGVASVGQGRRTLGYHFEEYALPNGRAVFMTGEADTRGGSWNVHAPGDKTVPCIISTKSREATIKGKETTALILMIVSIALFVGGIACLAAGAMHT